MTNIAALYVELLAPAMTEEQTQLDTETYAKVGGVCVSTIDRRMREISLSVCALPVLLRSKATDRRAVSAMSVASSSDPCP